MIVESSRTIIVMICLSLGAVSPIDYVITDPEIDEKHKQVFQDHDIELIIATKENEK
jgi:hypothetical protein